MIENDHVYSLLHYFYSYMCISMSCRWETNWFVVGYKGSCTLLCYAHSKYISSGRSHATLLKFKIWCYGQVHPLHPLLAALVHHNHHLHLHSVGTLTGCQVYIACTLLVDRLVACTELPEALLVKLAANINLQDLTFWLDLGSKFGWEWYPKSIFYGLACMYLPGQTVASVHPLMYSNDVSLPCPIPFPMSVRSSCPTA